MVYTVANVFSRGLAIITMPIFTRLMTTNQIGIVNLYNSWFSMISCIATLSLTSGGFSVAMKEFENKRQEYISSVLSLTSIMAIFISICYFINIQFWNNITGLSTKMMILILIGLLVAPATDFWLAYERYEYRYKKSALLIMISALVASAFSIFTIIAMNNRGKRS
ncbi:lipopolysaccharide biosynthesis protein [Caproicibacterium sp. NSD3]